MVVLEGWGLEATCDHAEQMQRGWGNTEGRISGVTANSTLFAYLPHKLLQFYRTKAKMSGSNSKDAKDCVK